MLGNSYMSQSSTELNAINFLGENFVCEYAIWQYGENLVTNTNLRESPSPTSHVCTRDHFLLICCFLLYD